MAAKKRPIHPLRAEEVREKIRATLLVKRLEEHALVSKLSEDFEKCEMTDSQVRAALGLLAKIVPNVAEQKLEVSGPNGGPVRVIATPTDVAL